MQGFKVAVMNTSKEITDTLQEVLQMEGFETCTIFTYVLKEQEKHFDEFVKNNNPSVIIYDVAIPYQRNYELFQRILKRQSAKNIAFVLTTTNKDALDSLVGETHAFEIIGKPYDLNQLIKIVRSKIETQKKVSVT